MPRKFFEDATSFTSKGSSKKHSPSKEAIIEAIYGEDWSSKLKGTNRPESKGDENLNRPSSSESEDGPNDAQKANHVKLPPIAHPRSKSVLDNEPHHADAVGRVGLKPVGQYYDNMKRRHIRHASQSNFT